MDMSAMFKISYGLFVLSAKNTSKQNGCIVNTVMQVTSTPNRIVVAVNKNNFTHDLIAASKEFNISMLSTSVPFEVFKHFGFQSGKDVNKFENFEHKIAGNGIAYLDKNTTAYLSAKVVSITDLGTHSLFLADVTDAVKLSDEDSVTYDYYQKNIKPKPASKPKRTVWRCKICGYEYEGEELPADFICPLCKHPASDFEKIEA